MPAARELMPKVWPEKLVQQTVWERFAQSKVRIFLFLFALFLFFPLSLGVQEQKKEKIRESDGGRGHTQGIGKFKRDRDVDDAPNGVRDRGDQSRAPGKPSSSRPRSLRGSSRPPPHPLAPFAQPPPSLQARFTGVSVSIGLPLPVNPYTRTHTYHSRAREASSEPGIVEIDAKGRPIRPAPQSSAVCMSACGSLE